MRNLLYILVLLISFSSFGQNNKDALRLCSVLQSNSFSSNSAAEDALEKILGAIGASKRFVLQPCSNTNNAVATSYRGIRYILYDPDFMNTLNYGNNWGNLFILAHEVGHHINGHSLDLVLYATDAVESVSLAQSRQQELEADEFAGFVLAKLGGPISAANEVISKISNNSDDSYSTHPSRSKRLNAVAIGYNKASINNSKPNELIIFEGVLTSKEAINIHNNGVKSEDEGNLYEAIGFYSKSAKLNYIFSFFKMAMVKQMLGDKDGALNDLSLYINNGGKYLWAFNERARLYYKKELYKEALNDYKSVLYYDPNEEFVSHPYYSIGHCRAALGDMDGACEDWKMASEKGNKYAANDILKYCN
tara:strand:+ start:1090 stop:2178 length:1089 start_codon:yes stop_codon:yes gene_type:complete